MLDFPNNIFFKTYPAPASFVDVAYSSLTNPVLFIYFLGFWPTVNGDWIMDVQTLIINVKGQFSKFLAKMPLSTVSLSNKEEKWPVLSIILICYTHFILSDILEPVHLYYITS